MFSCNSKYPLSRDGAFSAHINDKHYYVSRCNSYYQKDKIGLIGEKILYRHPRFSNCAKENLPFPSSQKGASEPPLSSVIIHGLFLY